MVVHINTEVDIIEKFISDLIRSFDGFDTGGWQIPLQTRWHRWIEFRSSFRVTVFLVSKLKDS